MVTKKSPNFRPLISLLHYIYIPLYYIYINAINCFSVYIYIYIFTFVCIREITAVDCENDMEHMNICDHLIPKTAAAWRGY
jgi:predicted CDP-diglyceride synthetase/phosphatidate cytidylyltransferase